MSSLREAMKPRYAMQVGSLGHIHNESKKHPGGVLFPLCENAQIDRKNRGGCKSSLFVGEGVQIALFSLKGGAKFAVQKRGGGAK